MKAATTNERSALHIITVGFTTISSSRGLNTFCGHHAWARTHALAGQCIGSWLQAHAPRNVLQGPKLVLETTCQIMTTSSDHTRLSVISTNPLWDRLGGFAERILRPSPSPPLRYPEQAANKMTDTETNALATRLTSPGPVMIVNLSKNIKELEGPLQMFREQRG